MITINRQTNTKEASLDKNPNVSSNAQNTSAKITSIILLVLPIFSGSEKLSFLASNLFSLPKPWLKKSKKPNPTRSKNMARLNENSE
jgi:hypothetical protein